MSNHNENIADSLLDQAEATGERHFFSVLSSVNNSGANGVAFLTLDSEERTLTVDAAALGLEPDQQHPFHIHGFTDDRPSELPTLDQDADLDGFIEAPEGGPVFGPILLHLTEDDPATDGSSPPPDGMLRYPSADAEGVVEFSEVLSFDQNDPEQAEAFSELTDRLEGRGIQFHGLELPAGAGDGTDNEVDGSGGYITALPVANGLIHEMPDGLTPGLLDMVGITPRDIADFLFA